MNQSLIDELGDELYLALASSSAVDPLTSRVTDMSLEDAYRVQQRLMARRREQGERAVGWKIGATSRRAMELMKVDQPNFGVLTDRMLVKSGDCIDRTTLVMPMAEGEIAFLLQDDLAGPGVTAADVLRATKGVMACFEIIDSRVRNWQIRIQDSVADNSSSGLFVLGEQWVDPQQVDLVNCAMTLEKNGAVVGTGVGGNCLDSPANAVAWLANALGQEGSGLKAGEVILSGALSGVVPVAAGDELSVSIEGLGNCRVRFA